MDRSHEFPSARNFTLPLFCSDWWCLLKRQEREILLSLQFSGLIQSSCAISHWIKKTNFEMSQTPPVGAIQKQNKLQLCFWCDISAAQYCFWFRLAFPRFGVWWMHFLLSTMFFGAHFMLWKNNVVCYNVCCLGMFCVYFSWFVEMRYSFCVLLFLWCTMLIIPDLFIRGVRFTSWLLFCLKKCYIKWHKQRGDNIST
jgi:hypothetical protein